MPKYNFVCVICQKPSVSTSPETKVCSPHCRAIHSGRIKYHSPEGIASNIIKFWAKFDRSGPNGCWTWTGATDDCGYGLTKFKGKRIRTHRLAYFLTHGEFPDDLSVCHQCDNPPCGNPAHLWLGTARDNSQDKVAKGRHKTWKVERVLEIKDCALTPAPPWNRPKKLTEAKVVEIRNLFTRNSYTYPQLAELFGVDKSTIGLIIRRRTWTHI